MIYNYKEFHLINYINPLEECQMCDLCKVNNLDYKFRNNSDKLNINFLNNVFANNRAKIRLCKICDIQLFRVGEKNFLKNNVDLAEEIFNNRSRYSCST